MTRVIGIDPGYDRIGIAILEGDRVKQELLYSECFVTNRTDDFPARLFFILNHLETIFETYTPTTCALETLFFSRNQKTALRVAEVRGGLLYTAKKHACVIVEIPPVQIKQAITGYGKGDKKSIAQMLQTLLSLSPAKRLDDEYDAMAIALCCLVRQGYPRV